MTPGNPALRSAVFEKYRPANSLDVMTFDGTMNKVTVLFLLVIAAAGLIWFSMPSLSPTMVGGIAIGSVVGGLILALVTAFKPNAAPYTAVPYAIVEGVVIGIISSVMEAIYPGIVIQAVGLTFGVFFLMLILYRTKVIRATRGLIIGIMVATGAVMLTYIVDIVMSMFGSGIPLIHEGGTVGIIFSLVVVGIAAFNFIIDFHVIDESVKNKAAKWMEWYASWGLLVTLIWLYIEIIRLLAKLRSND